MPEDYGLIGMIAVFIAIAQSLTDSGFFIALIQKKEVSQKDYSTIFYFNLLIGCILYLALFFSSRYIADFYEEPLLKDLVKVVALNIIIISTTLVHKAALTIDINFKTQAIVNISSVIFGGIVGIFMALKGYGVWALVYQLLSKNIVTTMMYWSTNRWKPLLIFDKKSFNDLFGFGRNLLISNLIRLFFQNLYSVIIGKVYQAEELGYFTRATLFKQVPGALVIAILKNVIFSAMVKVIDDDVKVKKMLVRSVRLTGFILFPMIFTFFFYSKLIVVVLLTEKWLPSAILLQILSLEVIFSSIRHINLNFLNAKGRSDLFLKIEIIKNAITILVIFITFKFGMIPITIGYVAVSFFGFLINAYHIDKFIKYPALEQLKDLFPYALMGMVTAGLSYFICHFVQGMILHLVLGVILNMCLYVWGAHMMKFRELLDIRELVLNLLSPK
jgi:O-antigen/teichoic acid export membrane protein